MYNYLLNVTNDVIDYIKEDEERFSKMTYDEVVETLESELWTADSVTGNGSGSYTFSTYQAEENLAHNLDLLVEVCDVWGDNLLELVRKGAEACDVAIRCFLLPTAIEDALDELDWWEEHDKEDY